MSGTGASRRITRIASSTNGTSRSASNGRSLATSASDLTGCSMIGPWPSTRAQLRRAHQLEQREPLAQQPVLALRAAGLPHEPHRRAIRRLAPAGTEEAVGHAASGEGAPGSYGQS